MRIDVDCSCFLETSTHLQETKLKIVVLLSRVERDKTLGEIVNSQLLGFFGAFATRRQSIDLAMMTSNVSKFHFSGGYI
jgi:hypothetical protein